MKKCLSQIIQKTLFIFLQIVIVAIVPLTSLLSVVSPVQALYNPEWGVLAVNTDKSHYGIGDQVNLSLAVLNLQGYMVCDADVTVQVITPSNELFSLKTKDDSITINPECEIKDITQKPDYETRFWAKESGVYRLHIYAETASGSQQLHETVTVFRKAAPITITHQAPTRIFPKKEYPVATQIITTRDFQGQVSLTVPENFEITQPDGVEQFTLKKNAQQPTLLTWNVALKANEPQILRFVFDAPDKSPEFYEIGPVTVKNRWGKIISQEDRSWQIASDATFSMQTGYYVGNGVDDRAITGIGFSPDLVIIKDSGINGSDGALWKSTSMSSETVAKLGDAEADITTDAIQSLDSNGFTLGTNIDVNGTNVRFTYIAFDGSDCTSSGTFCTGTYTGNGSSGRALTVVGFQPSLVAIKRSGATSGTFKTASMATNTSTPFTNSNQVTDGSHIQTLDATGFTVGSNAAVNANTNTYWFFAFKTTSGAFAEGTFTGDGVGQSITGVGYEPDAVFIKNGNALSATAAHYTMTENYGDESYSTIDAAFTVGIITSLDSDGFTVGTGTAANGLANTIYWFAFGGAAALPSASGSYTMAVGSYTGNGTSQSVTGLAFQPDLVIVKHSDQATDQYAVFTTSMNGPDTTFYFANAAANFTGGITAITSDGFSVGADASVNTSSDTYHWQAFGNAWRPDENSGAANFAVGAYNGNGIDDRNITRQPFQADLVAIKTTAAGSGNYRLSAQSGDLTLPFSASVEVANYIQAINSTGFQIGTDTRVNNSSATNVYFYFSFQDGPNMKVGSYSGTGATQSLTTPNIEPNLLWIKGTAATANMAKPSSLAGDNTQYYTNVANVTGRVTSLDAEGFSLGTGSEVNTNAATYYYTVWKIPTTYTQNDFEWFISEDTVTLTDPWPSGGTDIAENTAIALMPATKRPIHTGDKIRIQMNVTVGGSRMGDDQQGFKLQYSASTNCTTADTWTDVGLKNSGAIWRLYDEPNLSNATTQVNQISTSNSGEEGYYTEVNGTGGLTNPLAVSNGNNTEWDWPVQNNGAAAATSYCFRMVLYDGTVLNAYNSDSYPKLYTAPAIGSFMRHGNFFDSEVEQGLFWVN